MLLTPAVLGWALGACILAIFLYLARRRKW